jgi:hypothetical protein
VVAVAAGAAAIAGIGVGVLTGTRLVAGVGDGAGAAGLAVDELTLRSRCGRDSCALNERLAPKQSETTSINVMNRDACWFLIFISNKTRL